MTGEQILALALGGLFGGTLVLAELANPDRILGTLRLKDLHALRTIAMFVLTSMAGVWVLEQAGLAHLSIKPAVMLSALIGGGLLGLGFGMTGFCPGTGLACAAGGRLDALVAVATMFLGALLFILLAPWIVAPLESVWDMGKARWPEVTGIAHGWLVGGVVVIGGAILYLTRPRQA
ncbi:MAG: YeeE/YedE thiosulfate transporter family protein [Planctomycetota bacterium]